MKHPIRRSRNAGGFTLIEILVAIVILSIGLLGVAALQVASLRESKNSLQSSQAMALAYSLADAIRANPAGAVYYKLAAGTAADSGAPPPCSTASKPTPCSAQDTATVDLRNWYKAVIGSGLPDAAVRVECPPTTDPNACSNVGAVHNITVFWYANRDKNVENDAAKGAYDCGTAGGVSNANARTCVVVGVQP
jgi:type IV pilus assembly protein PilV